MGRESAWLLPPIPSPDTMSPSPFLQSDGCFDSPDVLSGSKVCKTESRAETTQICSSEVATRVFVVTFSLSCARSGSLPLESSEWFRNQCTGDGDLIVPTLRPCFPVGLVESCDPVVFPWVQGAAGAAAAAVRDSFGEYWDQTPEGGGTEVTVSSPMAWASLGTLYSRGAAGRLAPLSWHAELSALGVGGRG